MESKAAKQTHVWNTLMRQTTRKEKKKGKEKGINRI
jgi:hypothetical protein